MSSLLLWSLLGLVVLLGELLEVFLGVVHSRLVDLPDPLDRRDESDHCRNMLGEHIQGIDNHVVVDDENNVCVVDQHVDVGVSILDFVDKIVNGFLQRLEVTGNLDLGPGFDQEDVAELVGSIDFIEGVRDTHDILLEREMNRDRIVSPQ